MYESTSKVYLCPHKGIVLISSPLMSYDSVTSKLDRLAKIKNFTMFEEDLANNALPQWMFITPNMSKSKIILICSFADMV